MPPIWPVQEAIHAWAENKFAGLCHGSAQKDAPLYFLSPVWISEAPWGCVQLCLREAGSPLGTRKSREAQWSFLAPCLGDLAAIPRKGITDVKLDSGIGDGTGCILDIRVLSVAAFLRRTMAEHNWIIHVSETVCKASFKNFYFGNLKHIQKWKELHHESVVDLCFGILNLRTAVTNCQNLGGLATDMYCLTVLKGRSWRCGFLGHDSSGGAKKERLQAPYLTDGGLSIPWLEMASSCVFLLLVSVFKFPLLLAHAILD